MPRYARSLPDSDVLLDLDSSLLRTLVAVVDTGSFVSGSRIVHRTASAVSMQMKRLETQIGRRIFAPHGRSVALTPDGEALLTYARRVLNIADEAMIRFNSVSDSRAVRLGMPDDYAAAFLPSILARFGAAHPSVELNVICRLSTTLFQMLDGGELDVALVTAGAVDRAGPSDRQVHRNRLVWAGLPTGVAHRQRPLPIAITSLTCPWRKAAVDALDGANISYRVVCSSDTYAAQLAPVLAGLAVAPLPLATLPSCLSLFGAENGLPQIGSYQLELRYGSGVPNDMVTAIADHIRAYFASDAPVRSLAPNAVLRFVDPTLEQAG
jgi:DNA-binding transcriptional LysR family regulator